MLNRIHSPLGRSIAGKHGDSKQTSASISKEWLLIQGEGALDDNVKVGQ